MEGLRPLVADLEHPGEESNESHDEDAEPLNASPHIPPPLQGQSHQQHLPGQGGLPEAGDALLLVVCRDVLCVGKSDEDAEEVGSPSRVGFDEDVKDVVLVVGESLKSYGVLLVVLLCVDEVDSPGEGHQGDLRVDEAYGPGEVSD